MQEIQLTPTSHVVLGLLELRGPSTPYELKQAIGATIGNFWSIPHSQIYAEPERLASGGYVRAEQEETGRRRKSYSLTAQGRAALAEWRTQTTAELPEIRDPALLRLFFGAAAGPLAREQFRAHRAKLAEYEAQLALDDGAAPRGPWEALEAGIRHEREWMRYWHDIGRRAAARARTRSRRSL